MNKSIVLSLIISILIISLVSASEFPAYYSPYVNDFAKILSAQETAQLQSILQEVRANTTAEVVLAIVNTASPYTPAEYRTKLFSEWKIGKKDKSNGLLILYTVQEKRIEVEVGYGLEGILPDSKVGRLLDENYVPLKDAGNITQGIIKATDAITKVIIQNKDEVASSQANNSGDPNGISEIIIWIITMFVFVAIVRAVAYPFTKRKKSQGDFWKFVLLWILLSPRRSGGGFSGGGGFGGGGGGFGGGGSGGGGAGR